MRDKFKMTATPQDTTVRVNMPVSEDAEASYDGPVKPADTETSDGVPAIAPDAETRLERSWDGPLPVEASREELARMPPHIAAVIAHDYTPETIEADAPTAVVTPMEAGYRLSIVKRIAEIANDKIPRVVGHQAVAVAAVHDEKGLGVEIRILRWRAFAAWFRSLAVRDFVDLKSTLAGFPPEIRLGARSLLRQLTEATHEAWHDEVRTIRL